MRKGRLFLLFVLLSALSCLTACGDNKAKVIIEDFGNTIENTTDSDFEMNNGNANENSETTIENTKYEMFLAEEIHYETRSKYTISYEYDDNGNRVSAKKNNYSFANNFCELGDIKSWSEIEYDEEGKEYKVISYDLDGNITYKAECEYDEFGNMKKLDQYYCYGEDFDYFYYYYEYDENNNLVSRYIYNQAGEKASVKQIECKNEYLENGNILKTTCYCYEEEGKRYIEYQEMKEYDVNDRLIKAIYYECPYPRTVVDKIEKYIVYEYDENGNETKSITYNSKGEVEGSTVYSYEYDDGKLIKKTSLNDQGDSGYIYEYEYDESDNLVKYSQHSIKGDDVETVVYRYSLFPVR